MRRVLVLLFVSLLSLAPFAPTHAQEEWDSDRLQEGRSVFLEAGGVGCHTCHGKFALGDIGVGPIVRGVDEVRIQGALEAAEEMGFLLPILSEQNIADVAYYLAYLDTLHPVKATFRRGAFTPERLTVPPDSEIQLIVENGNRSACSLEVDGVTDEAVVVEGRDSADVVFRSPAEGATLTAFCSDDPDGTLTLDVAASTDQ